MVRYRSINNHISDITRSVSSVHWSHHWRPAKRQYRDLLLTCPFFRIQRAGSHCFSGCLRLALYGKLCWLQQLLEEVGNARAPVHPCTRNMMHPLDLCSLYPFCGVISIRIFFNFLWDDMRRIKNLDNPTQNHATRNTSCLWTLKTWTSSTRVTKEPARTHNEQNTSHTQNGRQSKVPWQSLIDGVKAIMLPMLALAADVWIAWLSCGYGCQCTEQMNLIDPNSA